MSRAWPDRRLLDLFRITVPIVQAPMAGAMDWELAAAAVEAGALGSLPCAMLSPDQVRASVEAVRARARGPLNLNFFCHPPAEENAEAEALWRSSLLPYARELGVDPSAEVKVPNRAPFDEAMLAVVVALRPEVVSFHFGLPRSEWVERLKAAGCRLLGCATTVAEARWLEAGGVDAIVAQGAEAGGHRGLFLSHDPATQVGTFSLVPQVVDAVRVPVVAAGGIADGRGVAAAMVLGAAGVQVGTAFLRCPEARPSGPLREALRTVTDDSTVLTNVMTGRPARGIVNRIIRDLGPISSLPPAFPRAAVALVPLRAAAEAQGKGDFSPLWAGQSAPLAREESASALIQRLASEALNRWAAFDGGDA